jgi:cell division protein FtsL
MSHKTERARRPVISKLYTDIINKKANSEATLTLRREIFRLARIRDILGIAFIVSVLVIIVLLLLLYQHW